MTHPIVCWLRGRSDRVRRATRRSVPRVRHRADIITPSFSRRDRPHAQCHAMEWNAIVKARSTSRAMSCNGMECNCKGEIDLMENVGWHAPGTVHTSVHTQAHNHRRQTQSHRATLVPDAHEVRRAPAAAAVEEECRGGPRAAVRVRERHVRAPRGVRGRSAGDAREARAAAPAARRRWAGGGGEGGSHGGSEAVAPARRGAPRGGRQRREFVACIA